MDIARRTVGISPLYTSHHVEPPKLPPVALVSSINANQSSRAETTISYEAYTVMPCKTDTGQCRVDILIGMIDRENGFKIAGVDVKTNDSQDSCHTDPSDFISSITATLG